MKFIVEPQYSKGRSLKKKRRIEGDVVCLSSQPIVLFAENGPLLELQSPSIEFVSSDGMMIKGFEIINGVIYGQSWWLRNL